MFTSSVHEVESSTIGLLEEENVSNPVSTAFPIAVGIVIFSINSLVLAILRKVSTLSVIIRFLMGNLAVADCWVGLMYSIRGALPLKSDRNDYCSWMVGLFFMGMIYTHCTTAVLSGHMLFRTRLGIYYDKQQTYKVS